MTNLDLKISGMHCIDCAHKVEAALKTVPGVDQARVHYVKRQAHVSGAEIVAADLIAAVRVAGYDATAV